MEIATGHIHVFDLHKFVATHPILVSGKAGDMREYTKLVSGLVEPIPNDKPGWYLWGRFNDVGFWETIYLGKAGNQKSSSLRARIKEELLDERAAFWAAVYGMEPVSRQHQKLYGQKYGLATRQFRKRDTHFILWSGIAPATEDYIKAEERVLIAAFRPSINIQRGLRPASTEHTDNIVRAIDQEVSALRR